jgi:hypothetical protein
LWRYISNLIDWLIKHEKWEPPPAFQTWRTFGKKLKHH